MGHGESTGRSVDQPARRAASAARTAIAAPGFWIRPARTSATASSSGTQAVMIPASSSLRVKRSSAWTSSTSRARNTRCASSEPPGLLRKSTSRS